MSDDKARKLKYDMLAQTNGARLMAVTEVETFLDYLQDQLPVEVFEEACERFMAVLDGVVTAAAYAMTDHLAERIPGAVRKAVSMAVEEAERAVNEPDQDDVTDA